MRRGSQVIDMHTERLVVDSLPVEVRRNSRRKTRIGLSFDPAGVVVLEAPLGATRTELEAIVVEHGRWLRHRLGRIQEDATCVSVPRHVAGELLQYLGQAYELRVVEGRTWVARTETERQLPLFHDVRGIRGHITVSTPSDEPQRVGAALKRWYTREARQLFETTLQRFADLPWLNGVLPDWRVGFMRSQWGSCSASGRIALNTHLVKVPQSLIDYVTLHELCHLVHHDHSRRFNNLLGRHMPDWQDREVALGQYLPVLLHE
ncbi:MAG: SprT family zinc-dependent metalloprotease [Pseudomonadales bacterium]|nr:M48 family metallopeptidase [Pseudomonadales bacterium]